MYEKKKGSPDFAIFAVTLMLLTMGLIMVFSSSSATAYLEQGDSLFYFKRQLRWAGIGIFFMICAMNFNYVYLRRLANLIFLISVSLLVLVLFIGVSSHGATSWINLGGITIQPSESIKLAVVVFMAKSLSDNQDNIRSFFNGVVPYLLIVGMVCLLIMLQPDLGTAVCVAGIAFLMLAAAGSKISHLLVLISMGSAATAAAIAAAPYRMERFMAFLNPWADPADTGFQIIQSLLALGSGGFWGMGLGQGRQKFFYLPEQQTDFIYAVIGEELGFIGASLVLFLFLVLLYRGTKVALNTKDTFGRYLAFGITYMIVFQVLINVGLVTGSLPVTGITLPLISYGGSSLVLTLVAIGILLNISRYSYAEK